MALLQRSRKNREGPEIVLEIQVDHLEDRGIAPGWS
jgi:hypothetical protein